jgi:hypothetical protein
LGHREVDEIPIRHAQRAAHVSSGDGEVGQNHDHTCRRRRGAYFRRQACKLRLLLQGEAQLSRPFPERPRNMHRRTYERLRREGINLEAGLSKRMRRRFPDYQSLVAYTD